MLEEETGKETEGADTHILASETLLQLHAHYTSELRSDLEFTYKYLTCTLGAVSVCASRAQRAVQHASRLRPDACPPLIREAPLLRDLLEVVFGPPRPLSLPFISLRCFPQATSFPASHFRRQWRQSHSAQSLPLR